MIRLSSIFAFTLLSSSVFSLFNLPVITEASKAEVIYLDAEARIAYSSVSLQSISNATFQLQEKKYVKPTVVYKPVTYQVVATSYDAEIELAATKYGADINWMKRVMQCESRGNPNAVNASSNASGLFQFLPSTWRTTPYGSSNIFDANAQINAAAWMYSQGRAREWSCK